MRPESEPDKMPSPRPAREDDASGAPASLKLRLGAEDVTYDRVRVETGRVRVRVVTREDEQTLDVPLARGTVEVERVRVDREIDEIPPRRQEGDVTIIPLVEEILVVDRKLVLREELHVKLVNTVEQHRETITLRRQEAIVERLPAEPPSTDANEASQSPAIGSNQKPRE